MKPIVIVMSSVVGAFYGLSAALSVEPFSFPRAVLLTCLGATFGAAVGWIGPIAARATQPKRPKTKIVRAVVVDPPRRFSDRLSDFRQSDGQDAIPEATPFRSKMPFWMLVGVLARVPPKSVLLIRKSLWRIRRLAQR